MAEDFIRRALNSESFVPSQVWWWEWVRNSQRRTAAFRINVRWHSRHTGKMSMDICNLFVPCQVSTEPVSPTTSLKWWIYNKKKIQQKELCQPNFWSLKKKQINMWSSKICQSQTLCALCTSKIGSAITTENRHWMRWVLDGTAAFISFTVMKSHNTTDL